MQSSLEAKIYEHKFLVFALGLIALINIVSNYFGKDVAAISDSFLFILFPGMLLILSLMMNSRFKIAGKHGIAWVMFTGFAVSWLAAETTWIIYDSYLKMDPFPSVADIFYVAGYPFLFVFIMFYLRPMKEGISGKMLAGSVCMSSVVLISSVGIIMSDILDESFDYVAMTDSDILGFAISLVYPVLDATVLVPAIAGLLLFFKGQVSFLWSLMCLAIVSVSIADAAFVLGHLGEFYYTGHYIDIFFLWPYVFMSFGLYHHYSLFRSS